MDQVKTFHLQINGQVQGVGFRPFIFRLAKSLKLSGWVNNSTDGVHIEISCNNQDLETFIEKIRNEHPSQSRIVTLEVSETSRKNHKDFQIVPSEDKTKKDVRLSPDFNLCQACLEDLEEANNARNSYPFTTCTNCGPRFSIIRKLPYDRPNTTMDGFGMCERCLQEYHDPMDRRFYSQTNSCPECAIQLTLFEKGMEYPKKSSKDIIHKCLNEIRKGAILAVKGIGGYLILCDATNPNTIIRLRQRKKRPDKPFAVLYPEMDLLCRDLQCNDEEESILLSSASPIVLLDIKESQHSGLAQNVIAPGLRSIGAMLPYAPLLYLIIRDFGKPLVATSGNISGSPIIFEDQQALKSLATFCDLILVHDRNIVIPQDDSVMRVDSKSRKRIILRRSRGLAPSYFGHVSGTYQEGSLAMGADMKSSFSFVHNENIYISQYLGNLESFDAQKQFEYTLSHLSDVTDFQPKKILIDKHPYYFSHQFGRKFGIENNIEVIQIQHHKAHFAAILEESNLLHSKREILGVIWDGTGYGDDKKIWGGEFFIWKNMSMERITHFQEMPHVLGDKMAKEPRISSMAFTYDLGIPSSILKPMFNDLEWKHYQNILSREKLRTTSVGRLFDAVAGLLGIIQIQSFEGQAAMYLETLAKRSRLTNAEPYNIVISDDGIETGIIISQIIEDISNSVSKEDIAFRFHSTLVHLVGLVSEKYSIENIAFSGGVFQNGLLVSLIHERLSGRFKLHFHKELSPNDENISFGQLVYDQIVKK